MAARANIVVGAHYGDEGKGLATDYFCAAGQERVVAVRFSGGGQAGHTVVTPDGRRHVFHHFGAGTLSNAATFLSRFFVVNPFLWAEERRDLAEPKVIIDPDSPVTTPYDMLINQELEASRGVARHGSCGLGINETIERDQRGEHSVRIRHLAEPSSLAARLDAIRGEYVPARMRELNCQPSPWFGQMLASTALRAAFLDHAAALYDAAEVQDADCLRRFSSVVFEGSQGLGLDERYGVFPHVTRGRTGAIRAIELAKAAGIDDLEVTYVSRAYVTRHGAGPFQHEDPSLSYSDSTNLENVHQGRLRFGYLDVDSAVEGIVRDVQDCRTASSADFPVSILVTCMDQVMVSGRYKAGGIWRHDMANLPLRIARAWGFASVRKSTGPTREHVMELQR